MGPGGFFLTNPGLANILGRTDLDFENFHFFHFLDPKIQDFQVPRFPKSRLGRAWALGRVGPSGGPGLGLGPGGPRESLSLRIGVGVARTQIR